MKTYKEINDELHVRDVTKKKTIHQMMNCRVNDTKHYIMIGATCLLFVVCGVVFQYISVNNQKEQKKTMAFQIQDYIQPQKNNNGKTGGIENYKGDLSKISRQELNDIESSAFEGVVSARDVVVPKGYEYGEMLFEKQMDNSMNTPCIQYHFQKDALYFDVVIENQDRSTMSVFKKEQRKKYNGYQLYIYVDSLSDGTIQYRAFATKGELVYTMVAVVSEEAIFQDFLLSVLR